MNRLAATTAATEARGPPQRRAPQPSGSSTACVVLPPPPSAATRGGNRPSTAVRGTEASEAATSVRLPAPARGPAAPQNGYAGQNSVSNAGQPGYNATGQNGYNPSGQSGYIPAVQNGYNPSGQEWKSMSCSHCQELHQQASRLRIGSIRVNNQSEARTAN